MFPTFTIFASETTGPIYFETFQSLQSTNIVFKDEYDCRCGVATLADAF